MRLDFRPSKPRDIRHIAPRMGHWDVIECRAVGHTPAQALRLGMAASLTCYTGVVDGRPEAMFGVVPGSMIDGVGSPWFLGTDHARLYSAPFLRRSAPFLQEMQAQFPCLHNRVHRDNARSIRWLHRMGFTIGTDLLYVGGEPMLAFWRGHPPAPRPTPRPAMGS